MDKRWIKINGLLQRTAQKKNKPATLQENARVVQIFDSWLEISKTLERMGDSVPVPILGPEKSEICAYWPTLIRLCLSRFGRFT